MSHDEDPVSVLNDLPPQEERRRFQAAEMVPCGVCLRANPPTRTNCLYCLAILPSTESTVALRKPTLRRLEQWEQGYNNVLVSRAAGNLESRSLTETASLLCLEPDEVKRILNTPEVLPLARAATLEEATLIEDRLRALGVETMIVPDADLAVENSPPKRIRALEFRDDVMVGLAPAAAEPLSVPWTDVSLIVAGRLFVTRVEVEENKSRGGERDLVDSRELSADDAVLHIYSRQQDGGWRIAAQSFDFSCLRDRKGLLASKNYLLLIEALRERAPQADFDDSYIRVRQSLNAVWPMVQQTEGRGWRRARPGKYNIEAVTTTDNEPQFTRYSRLRQYLKLRASD